MTEKVQAFERFAVQCISCKSDQIKILLSIMGSILRLRLTCKECHRTEELKG